jgi:hypothetical protein
VAKATNPEDTLPSIESALKNIPEGINILRDRYKHFKEFLSKIDENEIQEIFLNVLCHIVRSAYSILFSGLHGGFFNCIA